MNNPTSLSVETAPKSTSCEPEASLAVLIRKPVEADVPLIYNSWARSYKHQFKKMAFPIYKAFIEPVIADCIQHSEILVACDPTDQDEIFGYIVVEDTIEGPVVHYVYVKSPFRRLGIATMLCQNAGVTRPVTFTHQSRHSHLYGVYLPFITFLQTLRD